MRTINNPSWFTPSVGIFLLRIGVGALFLVHGVDKLIHMDATFGFFGAIGLPAFLAWVIAIIETLGGLALILGFFTRFAALLLAFVMLGAYFSVKKSMPFMGGWELDFILFIANLALIAAGPGALALKKKAPVAEPTPTI